MRGFNLCFLFALISRKTASGVRMDLQKMKHRLLIAAGMALGCMLVMEGCFKPDDSKGAYLVRIQDNSRTVSDFWQQFEIFKTAYLRSSLQRPEILQEARMRLLSQMVEDLVLTQRARELDLQVSDAELEAAFLRICEDYPPGAFKGIALEHAIPLQAWKSSLRMQLLREKLVEKELAEQVNITVEEVEKYYQEHYKKKDFRLNLQPDAPQPETVIVENLRRMKLEAAYGPWISSLRKKYPVEVNRKAWSRLVNQ
jgi:hypothetical protein